MRLILVTTLSSIVDSHIENKDCLALITIQALAGNGEIRTR